VERKIRSGFSGCKGYARILLRAEGSASAEGGSKRGGGDSLCTLEGERDDGGAARSSVGGEGVDGGCCAQVQEGQSGAGSLLPRTGGAERDDGGIVRAG
jgi:hypothetical protein